MPWHEMFCSIVRMQDLVRADWHRAFQLPLHALPVFPTCSMTFAPNPGFLKCFEWISILETKMDNPWMVSFHLFFFFTITTPNSLFFLRDLIISTICPSTLLNWVLSLQLGQRLLHLLSFPSFACFAFQLSDRCHDGELPPQIVGNCTFVWRMMEKWAAAVLLNWKQILPLCPFRPTIYPILCHIIVILAWEWSNM